VRGLLDLAHGGSDPAGSAAGGWLLPALAATLPAAGYLTGVGRLRRRGRAWSSWRTSSFGLGLGLVAAALSPAVEAAAGDARGHMVQHLVLGMFAPLALALGAPMTLLLSALPPRGRRPVTALLRSRPLRALTHVATAAVLSVGGLYLLYLTPLYALTTRSEAVHHLLHLHLLVSGHLFAWAVAGPDPAPHRPGMRTRIAVVIAAGGAHDFLATLLYSHAPHLPAGGGSTAAEMELAAQWMYYGGHLADLALLTALFAAWYRRTGRRLAAGRWASSAGGPGLGPDRRSGRMRWCARWSPGSVQRL
jgi:putative membrane protein